MVLLDEIEKAHPDIFNILLQVFEDGHLTDGLGNRVNFKNTIIIMTSNIGARFIQKKASLGFQASDTGAIDKNVNDMVLGEVKRTFNPEFINRIDEIIVFEALTDDDLRRIMALLIDQLNANLTDRRMKIHARAGGHRLDHRHHLQGPVVRRAAAAPRHSAVCRGSAVRGAHPRQPARRRGGGLPRRRAACLSSGRRADRRPPSRLTCRRERTAPAGAWFCPARSASGRFQGTGAATPTSQ